MQALNSMTNVLTRDRREDVNRKVRGGGSVGMENREIGVMQPLAKGHWNYQKLEEMREASSLDAGGSTFLLTPRFWTPGFQNKFLSFPVTKTW